MTIVIDRISKTFDGKIVFQAYSAQIEAHRITCILGPSGCGKTTLLNLLMGLMKPDSGTISGVPEKKSAVFQEERLCETFSAIANVRLVCSRSVSTPMIEEHLLRIGLQGSMHVPVRELSGGMRRRVAIVRAILAESDILLMDEPFKGLDTETKLSVMQYVQEHTKEKTVVMVTHDPDEVEQLNSDRIHLEMDRQSACLANCLEK